LPAQFAPIKQIDMKSNMFRICAMLAGGLTGSVPPASATTHTGRRLERERHRDCCNTGAVIRTVHSLQLTGWKIRS